MTNFGLIKNSFNYILSENITNKKSKNRILFKNYVNDLKVNESLKTQFLIYKNIEDKVESDKNKALEFVRENINLMKKFNIVDIKKSNNRLSAVVESVIDDVYFGDEVKRKLHENISYLIITDKSPRTINNIIEATDEVANYIVNNKVKEINEIMVIPSLYLSLLLEKYEDEYSDLSENERSVLKVIMNSNIDEKEKLFKTSVNECLATINSLLIESDSDTKEGLLSVKEKLLNKEFSLETFNSEISKVLELTNDLKN